MQNSLRHALRLVLKQRQERSRKWPILLWCNFQGFFKPITQDIEPKKIRNFSVLVQNSRCNLLLTTWRQKVISLIFVFFLLFLFLHESAEHAPFQERREATRRIHIHCCCENCRRSHASLW